MAVSGNTIVTMQRICVCRVLSHKSNSSVTHSLTTAQRTEEESSEEEESGKILKARGQGELGYCLHKINTLKIPAWIQKEYTAPTPT